MDEKSGFPTVAVLMSTYNGEKYLEEQLDSIFGQESVVVKLFVRDDNSKDKTMEILESYQKEHDMEIIKGDNVGAAQSFMSLLYQVLEKEPAYNYYAFADQDDIWMDDKLYSAVDKIKDYVVPCLYCSNQTIYENGSIKGKRFESVPPVSLKSHLCKNEISGCTMLFNSSLGYRIKNSGMPGKDILEYRLHDTWIFLVACVYGKIIYDEEPHILYRIHANNTVGLHKMTNKERIWRFVKKENPGRNLRSKTANTLLNACEVINKDDLSVLHEFADYRKSLKNKMKLINDKEICERSGENRVVFAIKVIFGMF
jgi:rhamnosyltransferase